MKKFVIIKDGETTTLELSNEQFKQINESMFRNIINPLKERRNMLSKQIESRPNQTIKHRIKELDKVIEIITGTHKILE